MSSKYDFIKLKVRLREEHFYILSRFQLSRMLMFCKVPETAAIRIALDVKRHFVNQDRMEARQEELEAVLRDTMHSSGYEAPFTRLMPVITAFYAERIPLVLLITGSPLAGKTTLAGLLAARLNCNAVLNTNVLCDLADAVLLPQSGSGGEALDAEQSRCLRVANVVVAEIEKTLREGKVLIVEGADLELGLHRRFLDRTSNEGSIVLGVYLKGSTAARAATVVWGERASGSAPADAAATAVAALDATREAELECGFNGEGLSLLGYLDLEDSDPGCAGGTYLPRTTNPQDSDQATVWLVNVPRPSLLPAAADALHATIVNRILAELLARGCLDADSYEQLRT